MVIDEVSKNVSVCVVSGCKSYFGSEANWKVDIQCRTKANSPFSGLFLSIQCIPQLNSMLAMNPNLRRPVVNTVIGILDCCPWLFTTMSPCVVFCAANCNQELVGKFSVKFTTQLCIEGCVDGKLKSVCSTESQRNDMFRSALLAMKVPISVWTINYHIATLRGLVVSIVRLDRPEVKSKAS